MMVVNGNWVVAALLKAARIALPKKLYDRIKLMGIFFFLSSLCSLCSLLSPLSPLLSLLFLSLLTMFDCY
jgi:hypothetical protein